MTTGRDAEFWRRARRARDKLAQQYLDHPDVNLIDIGYAPDQAAEASDMVIRIHVHRRWVQAKPQDRINFPESIDGFMVVAIPGEYDVSDD